MSNRHRHDNKLALREQARRERAKQAQQAGQEGGEAPTTAQIQLFQQPVKVQPRSQDATTELAKKVLGDYDKVQSYVFGSTGSLLGVGSTPGTPQPNKLQSKTGFHFNRPSTSTTQPQSFNGANKPSQKHDKPLSKASSSSSSHKSGEAGGELVSSASHHSKSADKSGTHHSRKTTKYPPQTVVKTDCKIKNSSDIDGNQVQDKSERLRSHHDTASSVKSEGADSDGSTITPSKTGHSSGRHHTSSHKSPSAGSSSNSRESQHYRDTHRSHDGKSRSRSSSQEPSERRHGHSKHGSRSLSPVKPTSRKKDPVDSRDSISDDRESNATLVGPSVTKSPVKSDQTLDTKMAPPNGTIPINGLLKKPRHINLPKIRIPQEGKPPTEPQSIVEDIIKEMTLIDPPLTGISTPHKERTFPFPSGHVDTTLICPADTPQPMDNSTNKGDSDKTDGTIHEDLAVSDSDSDVEDGNKPKQSTIQSNPEDQDRRTPEPHLSMLSSSSESDSEEEGEASGSSSDSASDSESSVSDGQGEAAGDLDTEELALEEKAKALAEENPTPISPLVSPEPVIEQPQSSSTQSWSLSMFLPSKTSPTSLIGSDMGLCDPFKDTKESSLVDRSDNLVKNSGKSKELLYDSPDNDSDFDIIDTKPVKKNHSSTNRKHKKSSSTEQTLTNNAHKKSDVSKSPGHWPTSTKSPSAIGQDQGGKSSKTSSKSPATKKSSRKNNTASDKGQETSKSDKHRTSKSKDSDSVRLENSPEDKKLNKSKPLPKPTVMAKTESKSIGRGRPRIKPKSPKVIQSSSESSEAEEEMDIDVVTISPYKPATNARKTVVVEKSEVCEKLDFSTPPRNEQEEANSGKPISSPSLSSSVQPPTGDNSHKKKDSPDKKKERRKHDKQSEDKRKEEIIIPVVDKKISPTFEKGMCKLDSMSERFRRLSPIPTCPPKTISGVNYSDGKPSIVVRLNFSLLDRIPSKDTDLTSPDSGISSMSSLSSLSSSTYTAPLSNVISSCMDSTVSREDDSVSDLLVDVPDSAMEDDLPKVHSTKSTEMCSPSDVTKKCVTKLDVTKMDVAKTEILKVDVKHVKKESESRTPTTISAIEVCNNSTSKNPNSALSPGNRTCTPSSGSKDLASNKPISISNHDPSEDIIAQLCGDKNKSALQKRKRKYPKEGIDSKQHKPSSKSAKRSESSSASDRAIKEEKDSVAKSPQKTSERRGSASSNSSHQSHKEKAKRRKYDPNASPEVKSENDKTVHVKKEVLLVKQENGQSECHRTDDSQPSNHINTGKPDRCNNDDVRKPQPNIKLQPADEYILEAKKLKHEADSLGDKKPRSLIYTEAVLSFILSGYAMEQEQICDSNRYFKMYAETLALLKCIHLGRFRNNHQDQDLSNTDKKLSVLSLRIQSLLCLKLFKLKKAETLRLKKVIDDHNKSLSKPAAPAPSPHQTNWNSRGTGTPSPMSPTPSPAGSIGSVGSQSSCCDVNPSKLTNGNMSSGAMTSPGTVTVPQRIHSITSQYISHTGYLVQCHDLWDQADAAIIDCGDFFGRLDCEVGPLTLHSSIWDLVRYVRQGLLMLKDT